MPDPVVRVLILQAINAQCEKVVWQHHTKYPWCEILSICNPVDITVLVIVVADSMTSCSLVYLRNIDNTVRSETVWQIRVKSPK